jgi:hypothetical protein
MSINSNFIKLSVLQDRTAPFDPVLGITYYGQFGQPLNATAFNTNGIKHPVVQMTGVQFGFPSAPAALYTRFAYYDDQGNLVDNIVTPQTSDAFYALL